MIRRASLCGTAASESLPGNCSTEPALSRFMLPSMKASGLLRNRPTSIWSSEMPLTWVRAATLDSESPARTRYSDAAATGGRAGAGVGTGAAAGGRATASGAGTEAAPMRGRAVVTAGAGAGTASLDACVPGAGAAATAGGAVMTGAGLGRLGGSNSNVYSRTSRPLDQVSSRMTSTKGSCTARSLLTRSTVRPPCRATCTWAEVSTGL
jgi:hypothetical protein